ncbi:MAG: hypothetical protein IPK97_21365 [Ahniella sp.]|nr:hypothetical protein [Ahniella sp.]
MAPLIGEAVPVVNHAVRGQTQPMARSKPPDTEAGVVWRILDQDVP